MGTESKLAAAHTLHTMPAGVRLSGHKSPSTEQAIQRSTLPERLILSLGQHMGAPSQPAVAVGDKVLGGQIIARRSPGISSDMHAPSSGTVVEIKDMSIAHPSGLSDLCIVIAPDGKDQWRKPKPMDIKRAKPAQIRERLAGAGIIGMGGAGFPAAIKLPQSPSPSPVDTLIVNGVECEPYITADDMLMRHHSTEIMTGIAALSKILSLKKILIAVEDNKPQALSAMSAALSDDIGIRCDDVSIVATPTQYPSGGEKQLIQILLGKEVPNKSLPASLGVICQNVGTIYAIADALSRDRPLVERVITLTGDALSKPRNYWSPVGVPVSHLLEQSGYSKDTLATLIMGGPMMGYEIPDPSVPITKTSNCIIAGDLAEFPAPPPQQPCIRCGLCAEVCPANLLPQQLYWYARAKEHPKLEEYHLFDCIECGACAWVCPSNIPLVQYYRSAKGEIRQRQGVEEMAQRSKQRFDFHQERVVKEKELALERRKARRAQLSKNAKKEKQAEVTAAMKRTAESAKNKTNE